jgi:hypothetical protein
MSMVENRVLVPVVGALAIMGLGYMFHFVWAATALAACCVGYAAFGSKKKGSSTGQPHKATAQHSGRLMVVLVAEGGPLDKQEFSIYEEGASCGRHTSNAIVIPEAAVSRQHFKVQYRAELGSFFVVDRGSTTGSVFIRWLNFIKHAVFHEGTFFFLKAHSTFRLTLGAQIRVGETELQGTPPFPPNVFFPHLFFTLPCWSVTSIDASSNSPVLQLKFTEGPRKGVTQTIGPTKVTIGNELMPVVLIQSFTRRFVRYRQEKRKYIVHCKRSYFIWPAL